jgi:hypothetical protein
VLKAETIVEKAVEDKDKKAWSNDLLELQVKY